jgi:anaerobic selenocysteine-containing dehydrogenase
MREVKTYCRLCSGACGMVVTLDADGRPVKARGDADHAMSQGYACIKGVQSPAIHASPSRILRPLKRTPGGDFEEIPLAQALDEIAGKLGEIIARHGPRSVALFRGTPNYSNAAASYMVRYFLKAIGSPCFFSTMTIDQSAKGVPDERLGSWGAGRHRFETADEDAVIVQGVGMVAGQQQLAVHAVDRSAVGGEAVADRLAVAERVDPGFEVGVHGGLLRRR